MKKALVLLLAIGLAGAMFAEDAPPVATMSAYSDGTFTLFDSGIDGVNKAYIANFGQSYIFWNNGTVGLDVGFNPDGDFTTYYDNATIQSYTAWFKMFDGMVTLKFGKLRDSTFRVTGAATGGTLLGLNNFYTDLSTGNTTDPTSFGTGLGGRSSGTGALVVVKPMADLQIGIFCPVSTTPTWLEKTYQNANIMASYNVAGLLKATAVVDFTYYDAVRYFLGIDVKAVKDLTAKVAFGYKYNKAPGTNIIDLGLTLGYAGIENLTVADDLQVTLENGDIWLPVPAATATASISQTALYNYLTVAYRIGDIEPGLVYEQNFVTATANGTVLGTAIPAVTMDNYAMKLKLYANYYIGDAYIALGATYATNNLLSSTQSSPMTMYVEWYVAY